MTARAAIFLSALAAFVATACTPAGAQQWSAVKKTTHADGVTYHATQVESTEADDGAATLRVSCAVGPDRRLLNLGLAHPSYVVGSVAVTYALDGAAPVAMGNWMVPNTTGHAYHFGDGRDVVRALLGARTLALTSKPIYDQKTYRFVFAVDGNRAALQAVFAACAA
jgi:hypothetical protein